MQNDKFSSLLVVGGGAWGTALASLSARGDTKTTIWARETDVVEAINSSHENTSFLKGVDLPHSLSATNDLDTVNSVDAILFVVPAQFSRPILSDLRARAINKDIPVALCSKGIERETGILMTDVLKEVWPEAIPAVLSGPSFAIDVANGLPTAVTLACEDAQISNKWLNTISAQHFRPYATTDLVGTELGGAVKNVLAIACGIVEGKGLGESAKAALIARGFAEFQRFGVALGGDRVTMAGLSGLGDLILTCSSRQSRNMSLGYEIGQGKSASEIMASRNTVSEGAATAKPLVELAVKHGVEMPICSAVKNIIEGTVDVDEAINQLLSRPLKEEGQ